MHIAEYCVTDIKSMLAVADILRDAGETEMHLRYEVFERLWHSVIVTWDPNDLIWQSLNKAEWWPKPLCQTVRFALWPKDTKPPKGTLK